MSRAKPYIIKLDSWGSRDRPGEKLWHLEWPYTAPNGRTFWDAADYWTWGEAMSAALSVCKARVN